MSQHLTRRSLVAGLTTGAVALTVGTTTVQGQTTDAAEQLRQFIEIAYGHADRATIERVVDEVIAADWTPEDPRDVSGRDALKVRLLAGNEVFLILWRKWTLTIDEVFATSDRAAARFTVDGTGHDGAHSSLPMLIIAHTVDGLLTRVWTGTGSLSVSPEATPKTG